MDASAAGGWELQGAPDYSAVAPEWGSLDSREEDTESLFYEDELEDPIDVMAQHSTAAHTQRVDDDEDDGYEYFDYQQAGIIDEDEMWPSQYVGVEQGPIDDPLDLERLQGNLPPSLDGLPPSLDGLGMAPPDVGGELFHSYRKPPSFPGYALEDDHFSGVSFGGLEARDCDRSGIPSGRSFASRL